MNLKLQRRLIAAPANLKSRTICINFTDSHLCRTVLVLYGFRAGATWRNSNVQSVQDNSRDVARPKEKIRIASLNGNSLDRGERRNVRGARPTPERDIFRNASRKRDVSNSELCKGYGSRNALPEGLGDAGLRKWPAQQENDKSDAHNNYGDGRGDHDPSKMMTREFVLMLLCHAVSSALDYLQPRP